MNPKEKLEPPHFDVITVNSIINSTKPLNALDTDPENTPKFFTMSDIPESQRDFITPAEKQKVGRDLGSLFLGRELVVTTANVSTGFGFEGTPTTYNPSRKDAVNSLQSTRVTTVGRPVNPSLRVTSKHTAKTRRQMSSHKTKPDTAELTESKSIELRESLLPSSVERKVTYDGRGNVQVEQKYTSDTGRVNKRIWSSDENSIHYHRSASRIASEVQRRVRASTLHNNTPSGRHIVRSRVDKHTLGIARAKAKRMRKS